MKLSSYIKTDRKVFLRKELRKRYFLDIERRLNEEKQFGYRIYPSEENIFRALNLTSLKETKVVILGQDPYHQPHQAHGLAFSVPEGVQLPPSLKNIYSEIETDIGKKTSGSGSLEERAKQGVLLLNAIMSVREGEPGSHQNIGWSRFTDRIIELISRKKRNCVFVLRGNYAKSKRKLIDSSKHFIVESSHPSPFSFRKGFSGSRPFSRINSFLRESGKGEIKWV